uniref:Uncharacterized protein n=1 Tax=Rhizophora mucronata TaxID=61149 RepID=A0A2P2QG87_RHIMU
MSIILSFVLSDTTW